jgi:hypothetical protein
MKLTPFPARSGTFERMNETCAATKLSPTATGDLEVSCAKKPGHVAAGDPVHEAWVQKVIPVRWRDDQQPS